MRLLHPRVQSGKVILDGLSDDFQAQLEMAVCNRVAHLIGEGQGATLGELPRTPGSGFRCCDWLRR